MQRRDVNGIGLYTFDSLDHCDSIIHAISTRHGGTSSAPFATLNLSRAAGDDPRNVSTNTRRLHAALALDASATVDASQVHGARVAIVGAADRGTCIADVDALLTNEPGVSLLLRFADCVPILLFDPSHRAIAAVHAGWRGTVGQIATHAVTAMGAQFYTRPRDLIACIGPSIGPCCYRVGADVIIQVRAAFSDSDELLVTRDGATHFDLWQANARQLQTLGVEQIEIAKLCTAEHTNDFYSARVQGKTGRFGAIIALR